MYKFNVTAFLLFICVASFVSCKRSVDANVYTNNNIQLTPGQVIPPNTTNASGTMNVSYNDQTRIMSYTVNWTNLSGPVTAIHIHGLAGPGQVAIPSTQGGVYAGGIAQTVPLPSPAPGANGSIQGSLFADGVVIRQDDLLSGQFYIDIHTAAFPAAGAAQLRGQITFP